MALALHLGLSKVVFINRSTNVRLHVVKNSMNTESANSSTTSSYCRRYAATEGLPLVGSDNPKEFLKHKAKDLAQRYEAIERQKRTEKRPLALNFERVHIDGIPDSALLDLSYDRCRELFLEERDPHSMGLFLLEEKKQKALSAMWAWGRRVDSLVDGINASHTITDDLVRWEQRMIDIYEGRPWDIYDVALSDTFSKFPLDVQLFLDLMEGTRLDITKRKHTNYDQICLYRYYIASSFVLLLLQLFGMSPNSKVPLETVYFDAITHGIALAEADTVRDVAYDASMGRIYFPSNELANAGLTNADIYSGKVTDKWRNFMRWQIKRAADVIDDCGKIMNEMNNMDERWWLWTMALLYRQDMETTEAMDYQNLTKKVPRRRVKTLWAFLLGYLKSRSFI